MDNLETIEVAEVIDETPSIKTFVLGKRISAEPGQFAMLWIPGVGEKPFSFSSTKKTAFTVKKVGAFTEALFKIKAGDYVGVRGPYGRGFKAAGKNVCVAGGGVGFAPLKPLIDKLIESGRKVTIIQGASNAKELMWLPELKKKKAKLLIATEDGTCGSRGSVCDVLNLLLKEEKIDQIYTCGPEIMMKIIADTALRRNIPCQISLERYMKCAVGLCGQCCIDPSGMRVCRDGPVFSAKELKKSEFGFYRRDASGTKTVI